MVITIQDYIVCSIYLVIIYIFVYSYARKKYWKDPLTYKFFLWGFTVRAFSAIALGLVYQYYYGYGDTFGYFRMAKFFSGVIEGEPGEAFNILFIGNQDYLALKSFQYGFSSWYAFNPATVFTSRICALFNYLSFGLYLPTALFFALFSFSGLWMLYKVFKNIFPQLKKDLAIIILFTPSVFFWGSGILKDSLTIGSLGWLTWACYTIFLKKTIKLSAILTAFAGFYVIYEIKPYILYAYLPALIGLIFLTYRQNLKNRALKQFITFLLLVTVLTGFLLMNATMFSEIEQSSVSNITQQAINTGQGISDLSAGSSYSLGSYEPGLIGILKLAFPALIVTLYRPFVWEASNPFSFLSALESTFFIFFTLYVLKKTGFKKLFQIIISKPVVIYCLTFSIMFSIPVGIASGNFGTLVRYKIPGIPFFACGLLFIYYYATGNGIFSKSRKPNINYVKGQRVSRLA